MEENDLYSLVVVHLGLISNRGNGWDFINGQEAGCVKFFIISIA